MSKTLDYTIAAVAVIALVFLVSMFTSSPEPAGPLAKKKSSGAPTINERVEERIREQKKKREETGNPENRREAESSTSRTSSSSERWNRVVLHHSGTSSGTVEGFDRFHREERGIPGGIVYHFLIGNGNGIGNGVIKTTARWEEKKPGPQTGVDRIDGTAIGICLVGNFNQAPPTDRQRRYLMKLLKSLIQTYGIPVSEIRGANEWTDGKTSSPGTRLNVGRIRKTLSRWKRRRTSGDN